MREQTSRDHDDSIRDVVRTGYGRIAESGTLSEGSGCGGASSNSSCCGRSWSPVELAGKWSIEGCWGRVVAEKRLDS